MMWGSASADRSINGTQGTVLRLRAHFGGNGARLGLGCRTAVHPALYDSGRSREACFGRPSPPVPMTRTASAARAHRPAGPPMPASAGTAHPPGSNGPASAGTENPVGASELASASPRDPEPRHPDARFGRHRALAGSPPPDARFGRHRAPVGGHEAPASAIDGPPASADGEPTLRQAPAAASADVGSAAASADVEGTPRIPATSVVGHGGLGHRAPRGSPATSVAGRSAPRFLLRKRGGPRGPGASRTPGRCTPTNLFATYIEGPGNRAGRTGRMDGNGRKATTAVMRHGC
jgi:hypothetical protein